MQPNSVPLVWKQCLDLSRYELLYSLFVHFPLKRLFALDPDTDFFPSIRETRIITGVWCIFLLLHHRAYASLHGGSRS